jgi:hypothetical protein
MVPRWYVVDGEWDGLVVDGRLVESASKGSYESSPTADGHVRSGVQGTGRAEPPAKALDSTKERAGGLMGFAGCRRAVRVVLTDCVSGLWGTVVEGAWQDASSVGMRKFQQQRLRWETSAFSSCTHWREPGSGLLGDG